MNNLTNNTAVLEHPEVSDLVQLALDLRWSWNHAADELWRRFDAELWDLTHNPWVVLQTLSPDTLVRVARDPATRKLVEELLRERRDAIESPAWFQKTYPKSKLHAVAYFSMEFMLSEALPIYSGGLGNVAGDQLKAASDLGVPVVGIGLLYQQGYFRQEIDAEGRQIALYPFNDPGQLPITPMRLPNGEWLRIAVELPGFNLWIRAWQVQVGRAKLFLLDTNDPANPAPYRGITSELYGGGPELRLRQEMVLGIAGWRLLRALGVTAEVCHLNEGHAAFATLERAHSWMEDHHQPFDLALAVTRAGNIFTTHTPVEAGFDRFPPALMEKYLRLYAEQKLCIPFQKLLGFGRQNADDPSELFNMAYLAMRGCGKSNGVSRLHGSVSRRIFQPLFPRWPQEEVPIQHVTNGVHVPSWDSAEADSVWTEAAGKTRWTGSLKDLDQKIRKVSDAKLWQLRTKARKSLIDDTRDRLGRQLAEEGVSQQEIESGRRLFDPNTLTLGFARRFATYKRPNLLLHDPDRFLRILNNKQRPAQLILAGKAHPEDKAGQAMIQQWITFIRRPEVRPHVIFLSDYDMLLTERLVQGVDVWINTPRRPWEACGTSGMKVLVNGGLNISELDGWWEEAYSPEVGWAIGDGREHGEDPGWDTIEADALYSLLEQEIVPEFYSRNGNGIPARWVSRMRESMARLTPIFSTNRAVREYTEDYYLPAASAYLERTAQDGSSGAKLLTWRQTVEQHWSSLRFGSLVVTKEKDQFVFETQLYLGELDPDAVRVELYAEAQAGGEPFRQPMDRAQPLIGSANGYLYSAHAPADRPAEDYTPRVIPYRAGVSVPLETNQVLWQR